MKKFLLFLISLISINAYSQLEKIVHVEQYELVYKINAMFPSRTGSIRYYYDLHAFYLKCNCTEGTFAMIRLGETKNQAVVSLRELQRYRQNLSYKDRIEVRGMAGTTLIYKDLFGLQVQSVSGLYSGCINAIDFTKAVESVQTYEIQKTSR